MANNKTRISPVLSVLALVCVAAGVISGYVEYLHSSHVREAYVPGSSSWPAQLGVAAVAIVLLVLAWWRSGPGVVLHPLGQRAASRIAVTMRRAGSRFVLALVPLAVIAYCLWRIGKQITGGLNPNFTVNAWGGPSYGGAMFCHYLDCGLIIAVCAWLLNKILLPGPVTSRP
jgi:hypothetical protein